MQVTQPATGGNPNPTKYQVVVSAARPPIGATTPGEFDFVSPPGNPFASITTIISNIWFQQNFALFDENIVEMAFPPRTTQNYGTHNPPIAFSYLGPSWTADALPAPPPQIDGMTIIRVKSEITPGRIAHEVVVRDNLMRRIGDSPNPQSFTESYAVRFNSCENLIVEGNVIGNVNNNVFPRQVQEFAYSDCTAVKAFNNQYPTGKLRQLFNDPSWKGNLEFWVDEIETEAETMFLGLNRRRKRGVTIVR